MEAAVIPIKQHFFSNLITKTSSASILPGKSNIMVINKDGLMGESIRGPSDGSQTAVTSLLLLCFSSIFSVFGSRLGFTHFIFSHTSLRGSALYSSCYVAIVIERKIAY